MSYDLIFWRGWPIEDPGEVWRKLRGGEPLRFVASIFRDEVIDAFRREFPDLQVEGDEGPILGPWFQLQMRDEARYLHITCAWAIVQDPAGEAIRRKIVQAGRRGLGCFVFDPQTMRAQQPVRVVEERPIASAAPPVEPTGPREGDEIAHAKFGRGRVVATDPGREKLTIDFESGERRVVLARFVERV